MHTFYWSIHGFYHCRHPFFRYVEHEHLGAAHRRTGRCIKHNIGVPAGCAFVVSSPAGPLLSKHAVQNEHQLYGSISGLTPSFNGTKSSESWRAATAYKRTPRFSFPCLIRALTCGGRSLGGSISVTSTKMLGESFFRSFDPTAIIRFIAPLSHFFSGTLPWTVSSSLFRGQFFEKKPRREAGMRYLEWAYRKLSESYPTTYLGIAISSDIDLLDEESPSSIR